MIEMHNIYPYKYMQIIRLSAEYKDMAVNESRSRINYTALSLSGGKTGRTSTKEFQLQRGSMDGVGNSRVYIV